MRKFLEIIEQSQSIEILGFETNFIRVDVSGKSDEEIKQIAQNLMAMLNLSNVKLQIHVCYNDENQTKPCEVYDLTL